MGAAPMRAARRRVGSTGSGWARRLVRWTQLGAIAAAALTYPVGAAEPFPATHGQPTVVLAGAHYVDAHRLLSRYGLEATWIEPGRRARFASAWTKLELEADRREMSFNGLRVHLGDGAVLHRQQLWVSRVDAEKLLAPLLKPATFARTAKVPRKIVIDPGHGGTDTGTRNQSLKLDEKAHALDVSQRLAAILRKQGYDVTMTRADDRFIPLPERARIANDSGADLFISVHFNSAAQEVRGVETYILTPREQRSTGETKRSESDRENLPGHRSGPWSAVLGYQIHRNLLARLEAPDRGLKRARFVVLREVHCPAVLVEAGYLSNSSEAKKISTAAYRDSIAEAIADGIASYASQVEVAKQG